ncbi:FimV/HubP family polar landmark protein [Undibacterium luofuense]|uniref:FimV/HubP family polar landmark protein n=1 Tax=Undibacterium luofuense TaxID=2828733 RepID=UPI0030EEB1F2
MQKQKRKSVISLGRNALSVAVASAMLFAADASATGMGRLTVLSALGQPLKAEIELTSPNKEELGSLAPKLASPEAFKRANIEFNAALLSLQFGIEQRGNNYIIKVTSSQPMNEPFVDMLLELNSSNGKLLREYTFLLDPVDLRTGQSAQVAAKNGASQIRTAPQPVQSVPAQQAAKKQVAAANPSQPPAKTVAEHAVKPGETLSKIAGAYRSEGVSLDQMLVALYKANKDAFVGSNMNRLRAGQILQIPDAESVKAAAPNATEAHSVVIAHSNDFSAYRGKLAEQVERAPAARTAPAKQAASGKITAKVKETPTPSAESPDKLKLSKAEAGNKAAEAEKIAKEKAVAEANSRVKELEKNVGELQKLLDVKNKDLAAKEAELTAKSAKKDGKEVKEAEKPVAQPAPVVASSAATASAPAAVQASAVASAPAVASASASASAEKPRRRPVAPPPPPPEPSFFESLSDWAMPAGAGLIAILAGVGLWANQRRKKQQQFEDSILTGSSMKANSMFGSTGGQSVDTNNSVFNSNFAPSASQLDANEVDPVAEADVYIAYGRDTQAEEILKEALRTQPDRHAVRLKLLEIYFARKDSRQFERVASELYGMTSGTGEEWAQAASMGVSLEPANPLYAGGESKEAAVSDAGIGMPTHPLEDLDPEALLSNSMSKDMLEAISIIDTATKPGPQVEETAPVMATESGPAVIDTSALDFDLGFGDDVPAVPELPANSPAAEPVVKNDEPDLGVIDFDFGEPETPAVQPESVVQSEPELSVADDNSLDFTLPELELNVAPNESIPDLSTMSFEDGMPKLDAEVSLADEHTGDEVPVLDFAIEESVQSDLTSDVPAVDAQASAFEFDLSGIDLNLDPSPVANEVADIPTADAGAESEPENAEMSTKLDLAVAYQEIGDREGARELLEEVVRGGNAEQRERANAMLLQLA